MPRVLNIKINEDGICLDDIKYDADGEFDDREDLIELGMIGWDDDPEDIVIWLQRYLVTNSHLYDRVDIDVEGLKGE
jgi:hypothetical protein